jgi:hypothetical protein
VSANAPHRAVTSLGRGRNQLARPLLIERHRLQAYPLDRPISFGNLKRVLELRPRAVAVLDRHDMLPVAQLEALVRALAERIVHAPERLRLDSPTRNTRGSCLASLR